MSATRYLLFIAVCPGLEDLLLEELEDILPGLKISKREAGVEVRASAPEIWRIARRTRLGESMRVRVGRFKATRFENLHEGLERLAWGAYVPRGAVPPVHVTCRKSRLSNPAAVKARLQSFLRGRIEGIPQTVDDPALSIRLYKDRATISVDVGGRPLHQRGYRLPEEPEVLRETLAAACVRAAAIRADQGVWDPFCGAGSLPVEAALSSSEGDFTLAGRRFAFEEWPTHDGAAYAEASEVQMPPVGRRVFGSDVNLDAIRTAEAVAVRAGVSEACAFHRGLPGAVSEKIPEGTAVITRLPHGRIGEGGSLGEALADFGAMLRVRSDLGPVVVVEGIPRLDDATGCTWVPLRSFSNDGERVTMMQLVR